MKLRFLPAVVLAVSLSSCLTWSGFEEGLASFKGRPISEAFDVLGYPAQQQQFGDDTVYTWATSHTGVAIAPTTSTTSGTVGSTPFNATTTGMQTTSVSYACTVKLIVGPDNLVRRYDFEGNMGGCEGYMQRLHRAAKAAR
ncbi:hypothetical protein ACOPJQ_02390 [Luteimonas dalianensis]|uniref:hypothetical protein n=1 Tax=Luteimonas dalianensis TaxID=1148196 RepID=UPI003BF01D10